MQMKKHKHLLQICGETVISHTVRAFVESGLVDSIIVVTASEDMESVGNELMAFNRPIRLVTGGATRAESAAIGFAAIDDDVSHVAIHDAARCLVTPEIIDSVIGAAIENGAATAGTRVHDTVKRIDGDTITDTVCRDNLYLAHTPQAFSREVYATALARATSLDGITDDNALIEGIGGRIIALDTGSSNIKITTREDLDYAEFVLKKRRGL